MKQVFIDVREPAAFNQGHVEGAINISPVEIMSGSPKIDNLDKDSELVLYCFTGARSNAAMRFFQQLGFTRLNNGINKDQVARKYGKKIVGL